MSKLFKVYLKLQPTGDLFIQKATVRRNSFITIQGHFYNQFQQNWSKLIKPYQKFSYRLKGDSNPNDKYVLSEIALWTMNFDTSIIKIGWKMGKLWAFKQINMANI